MKDKNTKDLNRRDFMELSTQGAIGIGLAGLPIFTGSSCSTPQIKTALGVCYHDCPDRCSWKVTTKDQEVISFQASKDHPFTDGQLCNKMKQFPQDVTFHPERLLQPLKRSGPKGSGQFEAISWEQAIAEVASSLKNIITEKGGEAVLPHSYGGNQGLIQGKAGNRFFAHLGASQLERTICGDAAVAGILATNGQTTGVLPEDIIHSKFILLWGTNPVLSNQHLWSFIEKARNTGAQVVVIDPFVSQTAAQADWHIQPLPGTDTVLALSMIQVILANDWQDQDYIDQYTEGFDELRAHVQQYTPEKAAAITGLKADTIIELAKVYSEASPRLIRVLIGMEHQANGASAFRTIAMLPAITGAWRELGGGLMNMTYEFAGAALNWTEVDLPPQLAQKSTRSISMIQLGRNLESSKLAPPIHALFVYNSNPAVTAPNQNAVLRGLAREDLLTVVLEHFMTDTARYADYVFPATTVLENWDLLGSWGTPYINLNQAAISPVGEAKTNTEFFRLLARAMDYKEDYLYQDDLAIIKSALDSDHPYLEGITFNTLQETGWAKFKFPEPWVPHQNGNFNTSSGKCQFFNSTLDHPLPEFHPVVYSDEEVLAYPLHLMTVKSTQNFLNSSHANLDYLRSKEGNPRLDISQKDADIRGISDGDQVRVFNQRGTVFLSASIRKKVRSGVVCMPQGFWPSLMKGGASANALTNDLLTDMGRGGALQEARVQVEKV